MTRTEAALEWFDMMEEEQVAWWRNAIRGGSTCPVCLGTRLVDSGRIDPEHGTSSLEQCPLCGPIYTTETEPAPF